ncbi:LysM peptidoglycan-binding domain-containing protein [Aspergillus foveolatus]|uniref:LysM peptidoglycan-binding domain-containing protein n=1 Tax=Aspergillus foveolatus TaxID=210207 RepID=UPI003CCCC44F
MLSLKSAVVLSLLPGSLTARSISLVQRGVDCSFSIAASSGDNCESFAASWGISVDDLKSLNPSLDRTNFDDFAGYCVMGDITNDESNPFSATTTTTSKKASTTTSTTTIALTTTTEKPTTTTISTTSMPGLASDCDKFHKVASGDQCDTIEAIYGITTAQFSSWNPYINDNCSNLWLGYYAARTFDCYVCVHVASEPQMPEITSDCKTYHKVQDGEGCWAIDSAYSITLDQFRKWNPTIDASCSNFWVDYYVCVGV